MLLKRQTESSHQTPSPIRGRDGFDNIVLQPSRTCNLNCDYCYLPNRRSSAKMSVAVSVAVANAISRTERSVAITWHGGEPLTTPLEHFAQLVAPFDALQKCGQVEHIMQSNGTLLDKNWVDFLENQRFHVGISIDGDRAANCRRVNWDGRQSFDATMRGVELLKQAKLPFSLIAVIGSQSVQRPSELYQFFANTGCFSVGINFEEHLGDFNSECPLAEPIVSHFWQELFEAWRSNPVIQIREFVHAFSWFEMVLKNRTTERFQRAIDLFPTIDCEGRVRLLSPEFLDVTGSKMYDSFVIGNVLQDDLLSILDRAEGVGYVRDFVTGFKKCRNTCEYFSVCGGGTAANKYFELGTTGGTVTRACRISEQLMIKEVLACI